MSAIAVFGAHGQVGTALQREAVACAETRIVPVTRADCDLTDSQAVERYVIRLYEEHGCRLFVNAVAYTAVDQAEEDAETALAVNWYGAKFLAQAVMRYADTAFIHLSTDYVFDGAAQVPYTEDMPVNPLCVYGLSKYAGEIAVRAAGPRHIIMRTSWIFGPDGQNFLKTMLRLGAEKSELKIVNDQLGAPTYSQDIARAILCIAQKVQTPGFQDWGIYHYSGYGPVSWYDFACKIFEIYGKNCETVPKRIDPISSSAFFQKSERPRWSYMDAKRIENIFGLGRCDWENGIQDTLIILKQQKQT